MTRLLFYLCCTVAASAAPEDGPALFQKNCAMCHKDPPVNRAPLPEAISKMSADQIMLSLTRGSMREQAASLSNDDKLAIVAHLTRNAPKADAATNAQCAPGYEPRTDSSYWNGWGADSSNTRFQPAKLAGVSAADVPKLQLKWAFGFAGASVPGGQPTLEWNVANATSE